MLDNEANTSNKSDRIGSDWSRGNYSYIIENQKAEKVDDHMSGRKGVKKPVKPNTTLMKKKKKKKDTF
jgi:hypothetical protein